MVKITYTVGSSLHVAKQIVYNNIYFQVNIKFIFVFPPFVNIRKLPNFVMQGITDFSIQIFYDIITKTKRNGNFDLNDNSKSNRCTL